ncbi:hypothetical protein GGI03_001636 [Coemansia sp. RSA 2337]|nr:hypothetical protein LPJ71_001889 [Coemansia sp. S17]KAJ2011280.1 hypothetical protein GGI14_006190 [Coemansia sp. S680]KAJ2033596.1 hypothetical protein H4S03_005550 [Coemansia sp. S3946]KAJ2048266.1 hypothetical protein GGI08_006046 [Coemansia sp. S2]KAJ2101737.1 hypothetical protein GGI09_001597 [Coemansia sp. S100]KAJ2113292.1 hypothetical protein IW146_003975 [Coemansia sp. RSA 922]KAJ2340103.1 hypothetical protein GGH92_006417 [Coemansia sp. RSA 2673]KAJ2467310.1 hypothetical protei
MEYVNRATGATKEQIGKAIGNPKLEAEGHAQRAQALGEQQMKSAQNTAEHTAEQGKSAVNQAGDKVKHFGGEVKQKIGDAFGSQRTANEGRMDQAEASVKDTIHGQQKDMHGNLK